MEIGLDADGAPTVQAFRGDQGQLGFRYLTVKAGGMAVRLQVTDDIMRGVSRVGGTPKLDRQLREAALAIAHGINSDHAARAESLEDVTAQLEALGEAHAEALERIAELERIRDFEQPQRPPTSSPSTSADRAKIASDAAAAKRAAKRSPAAA